MKHDIFEFNADMSHADRLWRIIFLLSIIGTVLMDVFFWRP
jgi:hypothetical protein